MPFQKGNPYGNRNGRPKKPEIEELRKAIKCVEKKKRKKLLVHFVERAFSDDKVLVALGKKIVPDLSAIDADIGVQPQTLLDIAAVVGARMRGKNGRNG